MDDFWARKGRILTFETWISSQSLLHLLIGLKVVLAGFLVVHAVVFLMFFVNFGGKVFF